MATRFVTSAQANLDELEPRANDPARLDEEVQRASEQTQQAEARNEVGVYVHVLPHYLRHPYDQASGRTLLKVGRNDSDVIVRFRTTALPEEPVLMRIYRTNETQGTRRSSLSSPSGRRRPQPYYRQERRTRVVPTYTRFLDEIARTLGLRIDVLNEGEFDDN